MFKRSSATHTYSFTARFALILLIWFITPTISFSEPLGYIARPDRQDIGVFDTMSNTVLESIALNAPVTVVKVHPSGEFAYVGLEEAPMRVLKTLDGKFDEINSTPGDALEVIDIVFDAARSRAYAATIFGEITVIDTENHTIIDQWNAQVAVAELALSTDLGWLIIRSEYAPGLVMIDTTTGERFEPYLASAGNRELRDSFLVNPVKDITIGVDGRLYVLDDYTIAVFSLERLEYEYEYIRFEMNFDGAGSIGDLINDDIGSTEIRSFEVNPTEQIIYLGYDYGVFVPKCFDNSARDGSSPISCYDRHADSSPHVDVTSIDMTNFRSGRNLEEIRDIQLTPDGKTLYVVGRRVVVVVDTATLEVTHNVNIQAGGGSLGKMSLAKPVEGCAPGATSVNGLYAEAYFLDAQSEATDKLKGKIKTLRKKLANDDIIGGRYALKGLINVVTWYSALPPEDARHIKPVDASSLICAAGNLLARLDAY